jgi:hypothetical protein
VLNHHLASSPIRSVHGLAKAVPTVSRSQLYLLLRGHAVIDVAELFAVCDALGVRPRDVVGQAEDLVAGQALARRRPSVAAYDDPHPIDVEQDVPDQP